MTQLRACDISRGRQAVKFRYIRDIHKSMQNTAKFDTNLMRYVSVQHNYEIHLSKLLPGVDYVAKSWALAMTLKALPLVHFWSILLLKEQMMTSV